MFKVDFLSFSPTYISLIFYDTSNKSIGRFRRRTGHGVSHWRNFLYFHAVFGKIKWNRLAPLLGLLFKILETLDTPLKFMARCENVRTESICQWRIVKFCESTVCESNFVNCHFTSWYLIRLGI